MTIREAKRLYAKCVNKAAQKETPLDAALLYLIEAQNQLLLFIAERIDREHKA